MRAYLQLPPHSRQLEEKKRKKTLSMVTIETVVKENYFLL
jgi:hypothetical protein